MRTHLKRSACLGSLLAVSAVAAPAEKISFTSQPAAAKAGENVKISFAVSAPTDVEVAAVDADGKIVRHLAAGVLGGDNPPPPPLRPGLAQEFVWDGKDDRGKPVGGPVNVRVRAGMQPRFDKLIGYNPAQLGSVRSLAVGSDGTLYVHGWFKPDICMCESPRFDVDGYGRSFFGDACGFRVGVLDTAVNLAAWFGGYGNQDSAGPGSAIPAPDIPIGWVDAVAVDGDAVFVGARLNQRVVRVALGWLAEEICAAR